MFCKFSTINLQNCSRYLNLNGIREESCMGGTRSFGPILLVHELDLPFWKISLQPKFHCCSSKITRFFQIRVGGGGRWHAHFSKIPAYSYTHRQTNNLKSKILLLSKILILATKTCQIPHSAVLGTHTYRHTFYTHSSTICVRCSEKTKFFQYNARCQLTFTVCLWIFMIAYQTMWPAFFIFYTEKFILPFGHKHFGSHCKNWFFR